MKKLFFGLLFSFLLCGAAFADGEDLPDPPISQQASSVYIVSADTVPVSSGSGSSSDSQLLQVLAPLLLQRSSDVLPSELDITNVSILRSVSPVTPSDASGLKSVLLSFLGDYDPVIVEYQYQNPNTQYYSYLREVQPDYPWLVSAAVLVVFIYCLFRLGGAIFCKR